MRRNAVCGSLNSWPKAEIVAQCPSPLQWGGARQSGASGDWAGPGGGPWQAKAYGPGDSIPSEWLVNDAVGMGAIYSGTDIAT